ncbi:hypothetical protein BJX96DRAFT_126742 [Aspergillus floccosus]
MKLRLSSFCQPGGALLVSFPSFVSFFPEFPLLIWTLYTSNPPPVYFTNTSGPKKQPSQVVCCFVHSEPCSDIPIHSSAANQIPPWTCPPCTEARRNSARMSMRATPPKLTSHEHL